MTTITTIITPWNATLDAGGVSIAPDGCRDLILCLNDSAPASLLLTSLDDAPRRIQNDATTHYIGLRFSPGARFAWLGSGDVADRDLLLTPGHQLIGQWVGEILRRPHQAEELLLDAAERWVNDDTLCTEFIHSLRQKREFGIGERQLRRRITQQTCRPPAYWRQLYRARQAARDILCSQSPLGAIAADYGFADQAHLNREMRRWFALTPGELRKEPGRYHHQFTAPDAFTPQPIKY